MRLRSSFSESLLPTAKPRLIVRSTEQTQVFNLIRPAGKFRMDMVDLQLESAAADFSGREPVLTDLITLKNKSSHGRPQWSANCWIRNSRQRAAPSEKEPFVQN